MSDAGSGVAAPKQNPTFTLTPTASPCLGAPEGKILVTSTSGNDFKVILGTGSEVNVTGGTYIFNNLFGKKVYTVTVKQNGCEATKDVTVNDVGSPPLVPTLNATDALPLLNALDVPEFVATTEVGCPGRTGEDANQPCAVYISKYPKSPL
jgi:hypothetical protein